jgi:hypothetical protein
MNQDASRWWAPALRAEWLAIINRSADEDWDLKRFDAAMEWIRSPRWVPERRPARLASMWAIASYWAEQGDWFDIILTRPHCFACGLHGGYPEDENDPAVRWNCAKRLRGLSEGACVDAVTSPSSSPGRPGRSPRTSTRRYATRSARHRARSCRSTRRQP